MRAMIMLETMVVLALLTCAAGCGDGGGDEAGKVVITREAEFSSDTAAAIPDDSDAYVHPEGRFRVHWPDGCSRGRSRLTESRFRPGEYAIANAITLYADDPERGCSVTVWFEMPDGSEHVIEDVTGRIGALIDDRKMTIDRQIPIKRAGMEGVAAFCRETEGRGHFWIEAYLYEGRTLLVSAWFPDESVYVDSDVQRFFRSVVFVD